MFTISVRETHKSKNTSKVNKTQDENSNYVLTMC